MSRATESWLAIDIGGANIKAAHEQGQARALPFELWKRPDELGEVLSRLAAVFPPIGRVAITMTAELCDCYPTKAVGVRSVLDATKAAFPSLPIHVWGIDNTFHSVEDIQIRPARAAAANWLALADVAARLIPKGAGVLIDIGTTTTDLIPVLDGHSAARGRSDTERLQTGELVYAGVRRTPICALATELAFHGKPTGLAAELFASTLDVYLTLGEIPDDPKDHSTADGRSATTDAARDRLARMVGADRDSFSKEDARAFAQAANDLLLARLSAALERACRHVGRPGTAVISGSGEFLAQRLAQRSIAPGGSIIRLNDAWGELASSAGCASALLVLARERLGSTPNRGEIAV